MSRILSITPSAGSTTLFQGGVDGVRGCGRVGAASSAVSTRLPSRIMSSAGTICSSSGNNSSASASTCRRIAATTAKQAAENLAAVRKSAIADVEVVEHNETPNVGTMAVDQLPAAIVAVGSTDVATVSGATRTSAAIILAVEAALAEAGVEVATSDSTKETVH